MEWRIRQTGRGDYMAEQGARIEGGTPSPTVAGHIMPAFIVREATRFETKQEAARYIKRRKKGGF